MSQFVGKEDFRYGLTTKTRGTFGNNPVLNVCHGYDPTSGDLVPVRSVSDIPESGYGDIYFYAANKDFAIHHKGEFYTLADLSLETVSSTTLANFYGQPTLYSKPVISGTQIIYPTDKGLFAYEPGAASGKQNVRPLSIMSPMDFDDENISAKREENNRPLVSNATPLGGRTPVFGVGDTYDTDDDDNNATCTVTPFKCSSHSTANDGIKIQPVNAQAPFHITKAFTLSASKGWLVYDIKIENDTQQYAVATMFENKDVTHSGYEIAFLDSNGDDVFVIGVPRCVPVKDRWYRCISVFDFGDETFSSGTASDVAAITFRCADYWENKNATKTIVRIGCMAFEPAFMVDDLAELKGQWRYIGNFLYPAPDDPVEGCDEFGVREHSEYSEAFTRDKDNEKVTSTGEDNLIQNANFDPWSTGWEVVVSGNYDNDKARNFESWQHNYEDSNGNSLTTVDGKTFNRWMSFNGSGGNVCVCSAKQLISVEPFSWYKASVRHIVGRQGTNTGEIAPNDVKDVTLKMFFDEGNEGERKGNQTELTAYTCSGRSPLYVMDSVIADFFTGNHSTVWFAFGSTADECVHFAPQMYLTQNKAFYPTSRILYNYTEKDLFDVNKNSPHICNKYSYSFLCRNVIGTNWSYVDTKNDMAKMAMSNPSDDSLPIADDPFVATHVTVYREKNSVGYILPTKTINSVKRNMLAIYGDYFRYVCFYRSTITGAGTIGQYMFRAACLYDSSKGDGGFSFDDNEDDQKTDYYRIEENWYADPVQPTANDYLFGAKYVVNLNNRIYCGYLFDGQGNSNELALAVSTRGSNWAFPATVDDTSDYLTGTQLDNLQSVSGEITSLGIVGDVLLVFYDKEIVRIYGNDFYSSNGFNTTNLCRLRSKNHYAIANTLSELIFTDGLDIYLTNGNNVQNISKRAIDVEQIEMEYTDPVTGAFCDGKYYLLSKKCIYVYSLERGCWYTIDRGKVIQLIEAYDNIYCVVAESVTNNGVTSTQYSIRNLFGDTWEGTRVIETFYQIISDPQADRRVNSFAFEGKTNVDNLPLKLIVRTQSQNDEVFVKDFKMFSFKTRYNNQTKFNYSAVAVKNRIEYEGDTPPTFYSLGEIRIYDEQVR